MLTEWKSTLIWITTCLMIIMAGTNAQSTTTYSSVQMALPPMTSLDASDIAVGTCFYDSNGNWKTFDGLMFYCKCACSYAVFSYNNILITTSQPESNQQAPYLTVTAYSGQLPVVIQGQTLTYNNETYSIKDDLTEISLPPGFRLDVKGCYHFELNAGNVVVRWDTDGMFSVTLGQKPGTSDQINGLCGNFNGNPTDEMLDSNGEFIFPVDYCDSFLQDRAECTSDTPSASACPSANSQAAAVDYCGVIFQPPFDECSSLVNPSQFNDACIQSYCSNYATVGQVPGDDSLLCAVLTLYAQYCVNEGLTLDWRTTQLCYRQCPTDMTYVEWQSPTTLWCETVSQLSHYYAMAASSTATGFDIFRGGCQCVNGTVFSNFYGRYASDAESMDAACGRCVQEDQCPCQYLDDIYQPGSQISAGCNNCTCSGGQWLCTTNRCNEICSVVGLQHFKTFDYYNYEFIGPPCNYTLVKLKDECLGNNLFPNGFNLRIWYEASPWSNTGRNHVGAVRFQIADNAGQHVLILQILYDNTGTAAVSVAAIADTAYLSDLEHVPYVTSWIRLRQTTDSCYVVEGNGFVATLQTTGTCALFIVLNPIFSYCVQGLCGDMDGRIIDDLPSDNGMIEILPQSIASYCDCPNNEMPILQSYCQDACTQSLQMMNYGGTSSLTQWLNYFKNCTDVWPEFPLFRERFLADACTTNADPNAACTWLSYLGAVCYQLYGENIAWMQIPVLRDFCNQIDVLGFDCPPDQVWMNRLATVRTCRDRQLVVSGTWTPSSSALEHVHGCACAAANQLISDYKNRMCVDVTDCTCYHQETGEVYRPGEVLTEDCYTCECNKGLWNCVNVTCSSNNNSCPDGLSYREDLPSCLTDCSTLKTCQGDEVPTPGCYCPGNQVFYPNTTTCVNKDGCPCSYNTEWYEPYQSVQTCHCQICTCNATNWICQPDESRQCWSVCWMASGMHYNTFDGYSFLAPLRCKYVMVESNDTGPGSFSVMSMNNLCDGSDIVCEIAVWISVMSLDNERTTITLEQNCMTTINDVVMDGNYAEFPGGMVQVNQGMFVVLFLVDAGCQIFYDCGTRLWVYVSQQQAAGQVQGLCGNNNGDSRDDMTYGPLSCALSELTGRWKTDPSCIEQDLLLPEPCQGYPQKLQWAQKTCGVINNDDLFAECRQYVHNYNDFYLDCVRDACTCDIGGDCKCLCSAIAHFAAMCRKAGVCVQWRSHELCPIMCDNGLEYSACGPMFQATCPALRNETTAYLANNITTVEGCYCPEGTVLNETGECIVIDDCPCRWDSNLYPSGTFITANCRNCTCSNGSFICTGQVCPCQQGLVRCPSPNENICAIPCDGINQCADNYDEKNCARSVTPTPTQCANGTGVMATYNYDNWNSTTTYLTVQSQSPLSDVSVSEALRGSGEMATVSAAEANDVLFAVVPRDSTSMSFSSMTISQACCDVYMIVTIVNYCDGSSSTRVDYLNSQGARTSCQSITTAVGPSDCVHSVTMKYVPTSDSSVVEIGNLQIDTCLTLPTSTTAATTPVSDEAVQCPLGYDFMFVYDYDHRWQNIIVEGPDDGYNCLRGSNLNVSISATDSEQKQFVFCSDYGSGVVLMMLNITTCGVESVKLSMTLKDSNDVPLSPPVSSEVPINTVCSSGGNPDSTCSTAEIWPEETNKLQCLILEFVPCRNSPVLTVKDVEMLYCVSSPVTPPWHVAATGTPSPVTGTKASPSSVEIRTSEASTPATGTKENTISSHYAPSESQTTELPSTTLKTGALTTINKYSFSTSTAAVPVEGSTTVSSTPTEPLFISTTTVPGERESPTPSETTAVPVETGGTEGYGEGKTTVGQSTILTTKYGGGLRPGERSTPNETKSTVQQSILSSTQSLPMTSEASVTAGGRTSTAASVGTATHSWTGPGTGTSGGRQTTSLSSVKPVYGKIITPSKSGESAMKIFSSGPTETSPIMSRSQTAELSSSTLETGLLTTIQKYFSSASLTEVPVEGSTTVSSTQTEPSYSSPPGEGESLTPTEETSHPSATRPYGGSRSTVAETTLQTGTQPSSTTAPAGVESSTSPVGLQLSHSTTTKYAGEVKPEERSTTPESLQQSISSKSPNASSAATTAVEISIVGSKRRKQTTVQTEIVSKPSSTLPGYWYSATDHGPATTEISTVGIEMHSTTESVGKTVEKETTYLSFSTSFIDRNETTPEFSTYPTAEPTTSTEFSPTITTSATILCPVSGDQMVSVDYNNKEYLSYIPHDGVKSLNCSNDEYAVNVVGDKPIVITFAPVGGRSFRLTTLKFVICGAVTYRLQLTYNGSNSSMSTTSKSVSGQGNKNGCYQQTSYLSGIIKTDNVTSVTMVIVPRKNTTKVVLKNVSVCMCISSDYKKSIVDKTGTITKTPSFTITAITNAATTTVYQTTTPGIDRCPSFNGTMVYYNYANRNVNLKLTSSFGGLEMLSGSGQKVTSLLTDRQSPLTVTISPKDSYCCLTIELLEGTFCNVQSIDAKLVSQDNESSLVSINSYMHTAKGDCEVLSWPAPSPVLSSLELTLTPKLNANSITAQDVQCTACLVTEYPTLGHSTATQFEEGTRPGQWTTAGERESTTQPTGLVTEELPSTSVAATRERSTPTAAAETGTTPSWTGVQQTATPLFTTESEKITSEPFVSVTDRFVSSTERTTPSKELAETTSFTWIGPGMERTTTVEQQQQSSSTTSAVSDTAATTEFKVDAHSIGSVSERLVEYSRPVTPVASSQGQTVPSNVPVETFSRPAATGALSSVAATGRRTPTTTEVFVATRSTETTLGETTDHQANYSTERATNEGLNTSGTTETQTFHPTTFEQTKSSQLLSEGTTAKFLSKASVEPTPAITLSPRPLTFTTIVYQSSASTPRFKVSTVVDEGKTMESEFPVYRMTTTGTSYAETEAHATGTTVAFETPTTSGPIPVPGVLSPCSLDTETKNVSFNDSNGSRNCTTAVSMTVCRGSCAGNDVETVEINGDRMMLADRQCECCKGTASWSEEVLQTAVCYDSRGFFEGQTIVTLRIYQYSSCICVSCGANGY